MHRVLRPPVSRIQSSRLAPDQLPELVVIGQLRRRDGNGRELAIEPQEGQLANRVGKQVQSDAERTNGLDRLEHAHIVAKSIQMQGGGQSGRAGSDDKNVQSSVHEAL